MLVITSGKTFPCTNIFHLYSFGEKIDGTKVRYQTLQIVAIFLLSPLNDDVVLVSDEGWMKFGNFGDGRLPKLAT